MVALLALIIFSRASKWWGKVSDCWGMCLSVLQLGYATDQPRKLYRHWLNLPLKSGGEFLPCTNLCVPPLCSTFVRMCSFEIYGKLSQANKQTYTQILKWQFSMVLSLLVMQKQCAYTWIQLIV